MKKLYKPIDNHPYDGKTSHLIRIFKLFCFVFLLIGSNAAIAQEKKVNQPRASLVETSILDAGSSLQDKLNLTATIKATQMGAVTSKVSGPIAEIFVLEGDKVQKGDLLATLDDRRHALLKMIKEKAVKKADAELATANSRLKELHAEIRRLERLSDSAAFSPARLETNELTALTQETLIAEAKANLDITKSELDLAGLEQEWTRLKAPFSGIITRKWINQGGYITSGAPAFTLLNENSLEVEADIPAQIALALTIGQIADIITEQGKKIRVQLRVKLPLEDARTGTRLVRFGFKDNINQHHLASGQSVNLEIPFNHSLEQQKTLVPKDALIFDNDQVFIMLVIDNKAVRRKIITGESIDDKIIALSGVANGDEVIIKGNERLRDNTPIKRK